MRLFGSGFLKIVLLSLLLAGHGGQAIAFDPKAEVSKESETFELFKFGFRSYKLGKKQDAVEAYGYAAEKGHAGSRWALATMYADGDGVTKDDYAAFKIYSEIAIQGIEPGSQDTGYFVNSLMALADYYYSGIQDSPVSVDIGQARELYFQAASAFGNTEAQFRLAKMLLSGEGGEVNIRQAKKWLNHARKSGHAGAMGMFGNVIFQEGQTIRGLAFMTAALDNCAAKDREWLQSMQERAFSLANEQDRRVAIALSGNIGSAGSQ